MSCLQEIKPSYDQKFICLDNPEKKYLQNKDIL